jgi:hypothetical protein
LYFGAVFITRREGAAFIGVAYSTDQLETKTNEKSRVGRFAMPQRLSSIRPLQEVSDVQFPDIRHLLILKLLPGNKARKVL